MLLLFDKTHAYLGEVSFSGGALASIVLSAKGDACIGSSVSAWQMRGIPTRKEVAIHHEHASDDQGFYIERIQPREEGFANALRHWLDERGIFYVDMDSEKMFYWELLLRIPFSSQERFTFILGLRDCNAEALKELAPLFQDAQTDPNLKQSARRTRAMNRLKVKLSKLVSDKLCRA